jgi:predicted lysophospholipase L1 biosynthesis ABC-type transport system permease subunit
MGERFVAPGREIGLLVPFAFTPQQMSDDERGNEFSTMVARFRPGGTVAQLDAQMKAIVQRNLERLPGARAFAESSGFGGYAIAYHEQVVGDIRPALLVLQAGVVVVLLIACANVANLQLLRAIGRHKEMAIRATLGASRAQILRHLLVEGLVLSSIGGGLGVLAGSVGLNALTALGTTQLPRVGEVSLSVPVLLFTLALAVITGVIFGLVPAMTLGPKRLLDSIKEDGGRQSAGRRTKLVRSSSRRVRSRARARAAGGSRAAHPQLRATAAAGLALALAVVGLYGVLAYAVSQRTRELGIRQALGAARRDIVQLVLRQGIVIAAAGVVSGMVAAGLAGRLPRGATLRRRPRDPLVLGAVPFVLLAVATLASLVPAWRATRIDPVDALRDV